MLSRAPHNNEIDKGLTTEKATRLIIPNPKYVSATLTEEPWHSPAVLQDLYIHAYISIYIHTFVKGKALRRRNVKNSVLNLISSRYFMPQIFRMNYICPYIYSGVQL